VSFTYSDTAILTGTITNNTSTPHSGILNNDVLFNFSTGIAALDAVLSPANVEPTGNYGQIFLPHRPTSVGPFTNNLAGSFSSTDAAVLALFQGSTMALNITGTNFSAFAASGNFSASLSTDARAVLTVAFDYTPATAAVPEPTTFALLAAGFAGFAASRRRA